MSMSICLGNRAAGDVGEYVGRPSSLGNAFRVVVRAAILWLLQGPKPKEAEDNENEDGAEDGDDWWPEVDTPRLTLNGQELGELGRPRAGRPDLGDER